MNDGFDSAGAAGLESTGGADASALAELIVRSATDFAIVTSTPDGVISSWSPGAERVMGWSAAQAVGRDIDLFFTPEDREQDKSRREMARAREIGSATDERWHLRKDGSRFWASGELQPLNVGGALVGYVKILRDRTEHRALEEEAERARAEAAAAAERLQADETRLREMFEATVASRAAADKLFAEQAAILGQLAEGVIATDADGRISFVNAAAERLHGVASLHIAPDAYSETYHLLTEDGAPYPPADLPLARAVRAGETVREARWRVRRPDGSEVIAVGSAQPVVADGEQVGAVLTMRDDTARIEAEAALRSSESRFQAIADSIDQMVWSTQPDGFHDYYNARWYEYTGMPAGSTDGEAWNGMFHPDDQDRAWAIWNRSLATGEPYHIEYRLRHRSGDYRWVIGRALPVRGEDGAIVRWYGTCTDIQDVKQAEAALAESRAYLRLLLDSTQEAFYSVDAEGLTQVCNAAFVRMLGFEREEDAVGRKLHDVIHHSHPDGSHYAVTDCPIYRCAQTGTPAHVVDEVFYRLDGTPFPVDYRVAPIVRGGEVRGAICTFSDVTEQQQTQRRLRESETRARSVLEGMGEGFITLDTDLRIASINAEGLRVDGRPRADIVGRHVLEVWPETEHLPNWPLFQRAITSGQPETVEFRHHSDVHDVWLETRVYPVEQGLAVFYRDVSERRQAQEQMRVSEERYRSLFEAIDAGFCIIEMRFDEAGNPADYRFVEINPAFARQTGLVDAAGKWIRDLAPEIEQHWVDLYGRVATTREPARYEDHSPALGRWFEVSAFPVDVPEANRVAVLFNDVSDRKKAEQALTELNRTLETRVSEAVAERDMIWRTSQDLFLICGFDGFYRSVNPAWQKVLNRAPEDLVGARFDALIHADDISAATSAVERLARGEVVEGLDLRMCARDGKYRWISWTAVPHGDLFSASGRDVTARKELEEQLRQSQKMEAVGQLTGGIAHDFNNLLTIVSGNIDMAKRSLGADGDARALRSLGNAAKGADRAAALTQRLLAFSRRQPLQPRATDVNKLIAGMTELLDRALGETVDLQVVAGAGLWRVEVDPNQLENAILNLAVNARDAMPGGGKLTVETTNAHIDEAYAAAQAEVAPGQYVLVSVTDTGEGMPPDIVAKAFDPFFSTKEVGKGTGLGLSQVYGYVKQSGGHVKIYSEAGHGTTIKLYLPRLVADINAADEEEADAGPALQGQESILVVEDDDDVRIYTVDSLRELGYRVLEAHDGASALRLLERQDEAPRLLLTDVVMPGMSGRELADLARATWPDMQVLFTTGYARNAIVHGGRLDAGVELLPKPFTYEALAAKIREVLEKVHVERALILDPSEESRVVTGAALAALGLEPEYAATMREALGKLRVSGGRFDIVMLSDALPVGNLDAVIEELHAVRADLPILLVSAGDTGELAELHALKPCVGVIGRTDLQTKLRDRLAFVKVMCSQAD